MRGASPDARDQRKRRSQDERAAISGRESQKADQVAVTQGSVCRPGFAIEVVESGQPARCVRDVDESRPTHDTSERGDEQLGTPCGCAPSALPGAEASSDFAPKLAGRIHAVRRHALSSFERGRRLRTAPSSSPS